MRNWWRDAQFKIVGWANFFFLFWLKNKCRLDDDDGDDGDVLGWWWQLDAIKEPKIFQNNINDGRYCRLRLAPRRDKWKRRADRLLSCKTTKYQQWLGIFFPKWTIGKSFQIRMWIWRLLVLPTGLVCKWPEERDPGELNERTNSLNRKKDKKVIKNLVHGFYWKMIANERERDVEKKPQ